MNMQDEKNKVFNIYEEVKMKIICGWHAANSILKKSFDEENYITIQKLNCLVYLLYSEYLYLNGDGLFNEVCQKTEFGPVIPSIYYKFNSFENKVINKYGRDASGKIEGISGSAFDECLCHMWKKFKNIDDDIILLYIEEGNSYSRKKIGEILTETDMLLDEISRKEKELENAKKYIKKLALQK